MCWMIQRQLIMKSNMLRFLVLMLIVELWKRQRFLSVLPHQEQDGVYRMVILLYQPLELTCEQ